MTKRRKVNVVRCVGVSKMVSGFHHVITNSTNWSKLMRGEQKPSVTLQFVHLNDRILGHWELGAILCLEISE